MFKSLSLSNFKAFSNFQNLPVKPITLIFGPNSSGKSSIIHSLLFCHEAITEEDGNLDVHFTKIGGDSVDLGGFKQFVFKGDDNKFVSIKFTFDVLKSSDRIKQQFRDIKNITAVLDFGINKKIKIPEKEKTDKNVALTGYEILTDEISLFKMTIRDDNILQVDSVNSKNNLIDSLFQGIVYLYTTTSKIIEKDRDTLRNALDDIVPSLKANSDFIIPNSLIGYEDKINPILKPVDADNRVNILLEALKNNLPFKISELLNIIYLEIIESLKKLNYLGPLRSYPDRHFLSTYNKNDKNWMSGGGFAWEKIAKDTVLRTKINNWFSSTKLETKYTLELINLIPEKILINDLPKLLNDNNYNFYSKVLFEDDKHPFNVIDEIFLKELKDKYGDKDESELFAMYEESGEKSETLESIISDITDDSNESELINNFIKEILKARSENLADLVLIDRKNGTIVSHRDVGVGISQILPVLVSAYGNKDKLITIEQPEIHIHPALQAELGDVFIESALGENQNTLIIETHSEHLILRILRRIRETTRNKLPEGCIKIKPEDISIVYVNPTKNGAEINQIRIDEQGKLIDNWPGGFFEESFSELF